MKLKSLQTQPDQETDHLKSNDLDENERNRLLRLTRFESEAAARGQVLVAGIDEAGRGPLAGPVVAAACVIPQGLLIEGVDDSKKLTPSRRRKLFDLYTSNGIVDYGVGIVDHEEIDQINILQATIKAMLTAVQNLKCTPQLLLVDGLNLPHHTIPSLQIIKGDTLSQSIALASIIAKETRDRIMCEYHELWPDYGFSSHKGYGTEAHRRKIAEKGPCPIHRRTFEPIASMV